MQGLGTPEDRVCRPSRKHPPARVGRRAGRCSHHRHGTRPNNRSIRCSTFAPLWTATSRRRHTGTGQRPVADEPGAAPAPQHSAAGGHVGSMVGAGAAPPGHRDGGQPAADGRRRRLPDLGRGAGEWRCARCLRRSARCGRRPTPTASAICCAWSVAGRQPLGKPQAIGLELPRPARRVGGRISRPAKTQPSCRPGQPPWRCAHPGELRARSTPPGRQHRRRP